MSESSSDAAAIFLAALKITSPRQREEYLEQACGDDASLRAEVEGLLRQHHEAHRFLNDTNADEPPVQEDTSAPAPSGSTLVGGPPTSRLNNATVSSRGGRNETMQSQPEPPADDTSRSRADADAPAPDEKECMVDPLELLREVPNDRYRFESEIARGGMGSVHRSHDNDLGRDLAVKVLLEGHEQQPEVVHRFIEEAQISGQLQHPGIAPVYELGKFANGRPFFSMKLVRGQTLAALLAERDDVEADRGRFVGIFEQICQTMAYAHSRGVIHRDLKPSNIMVGAFGEVQVMDWGVAKVMRPLEAAEELRESLDEVPEDAIRTSREFGEGVMETWTGHTVAGSVMGTPPYMPPEQALGEVDRLDERSDVFGLGAILCEILTGKPPYTGSDRSKIFRRARRAELDRCYARLDQCAADEELVELARHCLQRERDDRPRDASELAERVTGYLESVEERLRSSEVERAAQHARAEEERKRRRVTVALSGLIVLMLVSGGGIWAAFQQSIQQRRRIATTRVTKALGEARLQDGLAKAIDTSSEDGLIEQAVKLEMALVDAKRAAQLANDGEVDAKLRDEARSLLRDLQSRVQQARQLAETQAAQDALVEELELIRLSQADGASDVQRTSNVFDIYDLFDVGAAAPRYEKAFRSAGFDIADEDVDSLTRKVRESRVRESLIAAFDNWVRSIPEVEAASDAASAIGDTASSGATRAKLLTIVNQSDSNAWRVELRAALTANDAARLKELATTQEAQDQLPELLVWLGAALREAGEVDLAIRVLRQAQRKHLGDFWLNFELGKCLIGSGAIAEGLGFTRAAVAKRPESPGALLGLANTLWGVQRFEEAVAIYQAAADMRPNDAYLRQCLGYAHGGQGRLEEAIVEYKRAIELDGSLADAHNNLGVSYKKLGQIPEAIAAYRRAISIDESYAVAHSNLANAYAAEGQLKEAVDEYQLAIKFDPNHVDAHYNLGVVYVRLGERDKALKQFSRAIELNPQDARAHDNVDFLVTQAIIRAAIMKRQNAPSQDEK